MTASASGGVGEAGGRPTIRSRIVSATSVRIGSASDNHLAAGPNCRVKLSASGGVGEASGRPTVRTGIISAAGIQEGSAPDDHVTARPYCAVSGSASGRIGRRGSRPTIIGAWRSPFKNLWKSVNFGC